MLDGRGGLAAPSQVFLDPADWTASALNVSADYTFLTAIFLSVGLVNLFVPSGGGQWIVQGPIMCSAATSLSVSVKTTVLAVSYGDHWTTMIQPFGPVPLIGLTGANVPQFMG